MKPVGEKYKICPECHEECSERFGLEVCWSCEEDIRSEDTLQVMTVEFGADYLKPCPFCGGEPVFDYDVTDEAPVRVRCPDCSVAVRRTDHHEVITETWNTRFVKELVFTKFIEGENTLNPSTPLKFKVVKEGTLYLVMDGKYSLNVFSESLDEINELITSYFFSSWLNVALGDHENMTPKCKDLADTLLKLFSEER